MKNVTSFLEARRNQENLKMEKIPINIERLKKYINPVENFEHQSQIKGFVFFISFGIKGFSVALNIDDLSTSPSFKNICQKLFENSYIISHALGKEINVLGNEESFELICTYDYEKYINQSEKELSNTAQAELDKFEKILYPFLDEINREKNWY